MATTIARTSPEHTQPVDLSKAALTPERLADIVELYESALGDSDKADSPEDGAYYQGQANAYEWVLVLLTGTRLPPGNTP